MKIEAREDWEDWAQADGDMDTVEYGCDDEGEGEERELNFD